MSYLKSTLDAEITEEVRRLLRAMNDYRNAEGNNSDVLKVAARETCKLHAETLQALITFQRYEYVKQYQANLKETKEKS